MAYLERELCQRLFCVLALQVPILLLDQAKPIAFTEAATSSRSSRLATTT